MSSSETRGQGPMDDSQWQREQGQPTQVDQEMLRQGETEPWLVNYSAWDAEDQEHSRGPSGDRLTNCGRKHVIASDAAPDLGLEDLDTGGWRDGQLFAPASPTLSPSSTTAAYQPWEGSTNSLLPSPTAPIDYPTWMGSPSSLSPMTGQYEFTALGDPYSAPGPANLGSHVSPASLQHQHQPALEFVSYADAGPSKPAIGTGSGSGSGSGSGPRAKAKLRRASSSSKNVQTRDAEPSNEQKTRKSHNFVEKQYRNRLNAQFEALLDALPDTVKSSQISPAAASGGDSDLDLGERRLSKGEVLDLSRRYIGTLERERDALDRERHDLAANMDRLRAAYMRMQGESSEAKPE